MNAQRGLVQCPRCHRWFVVLIRMGKRAAVSLEDLAAAETALALECDHSKHKGRRKL